jgi:prepilin-type N-terminal cleavage/methylation domain-containing protein
MANARSLNRGFSLIELLVVIAIIALIVAIVLPALGAVRDLSRKTATENLVTQLASAASQFRNDQRRMPGYFTAREMGSVANGNLGMSGAENMMLDLLGSPGSVSITRPPNPGSFIQVGPITGAEVWVDPDQLGVSGSGGYFSPTGSNYKAQANDGHQMVNNAGSGHAGATESDRQLKDLVDSWGQPLLVWSQDEQSTFPVATMDDFARVSPQGANGYARYYVNQNACFLNATQLGKKGVNQIDTEKGGILATGPSGNNPAASLAGLMGQPSSLRSQDAALSYDQMLPTAGRGTLVIQSAGSNGIYLGKKERGAKNANGVLYFGLNFKGVDNQPLQNAGVNQSTDLRADFDDIITAAGN